MSNPLKVNPKLVNKSEIARRTGFTPQYISLLLLGHRKNVNALAKIKQIIKEQLKAA